MSFEEDDRVVLHDKHSESDASVTVDGDLVTARGPESSSAAETLLEELES